MVQEIITYLIVFLAVIFACWKMIKQLSGGKRRKKAECKKNSVPDGILCSDCLAECNLRELYPSENKKKIKHQNKKGNKPGL